MASEQAFFPPEVEFPRRVADEIANGRIWRAKEILRGRIGGMPYSPELYEQYGLVLLNMGDVVQAGKYLFLSGHRRSEYDSAIEVFIARHGTKGVKALISSFPNRAKQLPIAAFPANVQAELRSRAISGSAAAQSLARAAVPAKLKTAGWASVIGCLAIVLLLVSSVIVGLPIVLHRMWLLLH